MGKRARKHRATVADMAACSDQPAPCVTATQLETDERAANEKEPGTPSPIYTLDFEVGTPVLDLPTQFH